MQLEPKPLFADRMKNLLENSQDYDKWLEYSRRQPINSIRCNTLKTSPKELKERLESKGWEISQPFPEYPEIMIIKSNLLPGELGKSVEHILGYYYVQEISSMMPIIALQPKPGELVLDLCASPGSKTTQASSLMKNSGTIIANDKDIGRIKILSANLEKNSCMNLIVTRHDAVQLCEKLKRTRIKFDKILLDLPCSGEGTIRSSPKTFLMWNIKMIEKLSRMQRKIASSAIDLLKDDGEIVYSTCTHAPEENEEVVSFLVERFNLKVEKLNLPLTTREGVISWNNKSYNKELNKACRIYPQDNNTEGFFLAKLKRREK